jgi:hypothetical protein
MTLNALQALTWSTVAGAVAGALLLASIETNFSEWRHEQRAESESRTSALETTSQRKSPDRTPVLIEASVPKRELAVR